MWFWFLLTGEGDCCVLWMCFRVEEYSQRTVVLSVGHGDRDLEVVYTGWISEWSEVDG